MTDKAMLSYQAISAFGVVGKQGKLFFSHTNSVSIKVLGISAWGHKWETLENGAK